MPRRLLFSQEQIQARVKDLADAISTDYRGREPVFVGILKGVVFFFADLVRAVTIPCRIDFLRAASYGSETTSCGKIAITKDVELPLEGEPVILVEDIVDTGLTLVAVADLLRLRGVESLKLCALIDKPERRKVDVRLDYCGFRLAEGFIVGYGLDYNEKFRYFPDIYRLD